MQLSRRWADIGQPLVTGFMWDQMVSDAASITGSQHKLGKNIEGWIRTHSRVHFCILFRG